MKQTPLKKRIALKRNKGLKFATPKTILRNKKWRDICLERAKYLIAKYGRMVCEYSGETIRTLSSVADNLDDGWGHHIDGNRNNCDISNCMIVKYRWHTYIHDHNLKVFQEGFFWKRDK